MTEATPPAAPEPAVSVAKAESLWRDKIKGRYTAHAQDGGVVKGLGGAAKQSFGEMKDGINVFSEASKGKRLIAFGRVGAVGAGNAMAFDGLLRSKDADGNARSGLLRVGEVLLGTGSAAAGVFAGRA